MFGSDFLLFRKGGISVITVINIIVTDVIIFLHLESFPPENLFDSVSVISLFETLFLSFLRIHDKLIREKWSFQLELYSLTSMIRYLKMKKPQVHFIIKNIFDRQWMKDRVSKIFSNDKMD